MFADIYPFYTTMKSCYESEAENGIAVDGLSSNRTFDDLVGGIVNIIVPYDMGWTKRGNGRSYDSLNGCGTIIGFLSGKILDYAARNIKCRRCDVGYPQNDHPCHKNLQKSAKAMEADAGADLVNNSNVL